MTPASTRPCLQRGALLIALASCGPPHARQFVGPDGSRDWWAVECRGDQGACFQQAKAACHDAFDVHEVRDGTAATPLALEVREGVVPPLPALASLAGKTLVLTCTSPTVPPRSVAGPECASSPPRPNHCDEATGETFTTGRTYLPPSSDTGAGPVVAETQSPESALAELRTIADRFDAEVDAVARPILAIDGVVRDIQSFARTFRVKPSQVKALAHASLAGRDLAMPAGLRPEVADELRAVAVRVKAADDALTATPERASVLLAKIATRHARVKTLAAIASAPAKGALEDPHATAAEKASAEAQVGEILELQLEGRKNLDAIRSKVTELSSQIMQAIAKLGDATS